MDAVSIAIAAGLTAAPAAPQTVSTPQAAPPAAEERKTAPKETPPEKVPIGVRWKLLGELGTFGVVSHQLQQSRDGTNFDLRRDGNQDTMFFFGRISTELELDDHHEIVLLYQPLRLQTETVLNEDLVADGTTFAAGTGLDVFYGFDFYRASYLYDILDDPDDEVAFGGGLQFRNARSSYVSKDGTQSVVNTNFGPVPTLKFRGRHTLDRANFWWGAEVDGFYANLPFINGGDDPVEGLIIDASLRAGFTVFDRVKPFINFRYLGGGAVGGSDDAGPGDGFNRNWLHTMSGTLGAEVTFGVVASDRKARNREIAARKARRRARRGR